MSFQMKENQSIMITNSNLPICSYMIAGYYGSKGVGKTTLINEISNEFIRTQLESHYNIEDPLINNGRITHYFYLSPSIISDNTMKDTRTIDKQLERQEIELNDANIDRITNIIYTMRKEITPTLELQKQIIDLIKVKRIQELLDDLIIHNEQVYLYPEISYIKQSLETIEQMKGKYKELMITYPNKILSKLYQVFGMWYDSHLLRLQKIILNFDDSTCCTKFVNFQNSPILRLITQARHLYIFSMNIVMHSLSASYQIFKDQNNVFVLHQGIRKEQLERLFECLNLETSKFKVNDFVEYYNKYLGADVDDYQEREQYRYNYLYIMKDPKMQIWFNLEKKLK